MRRLLGMLLILALTVSVCHANTQTKYETLSIGSKGEAVIRLQTRLVEAGFLTGKIDGQYGKGTQKAVYEAQQALKDKGHSLQSDGIAGQQTLGLLYDDTVMSPFIDFTLGASGQRVIALQNRLIDLKFLDGAADGRFGQQTLDALKAFQQRLKAKGAEGIEVNGLADEATREYLKPETNLSRFEIRAPEFFNDAQPLSLTDEFLNAKSCLVVNAKTGKILFAKNPQERLYPASTTKMMTLLLALEHGNLDEQHELPAITGEVPRDSSLVPVYPGEKMSLRDLLYGLMLRSGNDAANAIAVIVAGSMEQFVQRMNERAAELGMTDTHFMNPHGYHDAGHYSTARDLTILAINAMNNPEFSAISSALIYDLPPTSKRGTLQIRDTSELLNPLSSYYYEGAFGIKSGYTSAAGFCYVGAAKEGEEVLLATIMGSRTRNRGWNDMARLFHYGFAKLKEK
ncbi:MAG: hypothetical protein GXZ04_06070 [Clostridiales bacterium]|nr:hypothetical protein [Clostridiales bacterium]